MPNMKQTNIREEIDRLDVEIENEEKWIALLYARRKKLDEDSKIVNRYIESADETVSVLTMKRDIKIAEEERALEALRKKKGALATPTKPVSVFGRAAKKKSTKKAKPEFGTTKMSVLTQEDAKNYVAAMGRATAKKKKASELSPFRLYGDSKKKVAIKKKRKR